MARSRSSAVTASVKPLTAIAAALLLLAMPALPALADDGPPQAWEQTDKLVPDRSSEDVGTSLAVDGDRVLAGAPAEGETGAAYLFEEDGDGWTTTHLEPSPPIDDDALTFGTSVALEGGTAVVGDPEDPGQSSSLGGAFYVFQRQADGAWSQTDAVHPPGETQPNSQFAEAVALEGDTLFVGAHGQDTSAGEDGGAVFVYSIAGGTATHEQTLTPDGEPADVHFGNAIAMSGSTAFVGAHQAEGGGGGTAGAVYVFERDATTGEWIQQERLASPDPAGNEQFGTELGFDGSTLVVTTSVIRKTAYVFTHEDGSWSHSQTILDGGISFLNEANTGAAAVDGDRLVVGGSSHTDPAVRAFVFERVDGGWTHTADIRSADANLGNFGGPVALAGDRFLGGAPNEPSQDGGPSGGAVLVFQPCSPDGAAGLVDDSLVANTPGEAGLQDTVREANCQYVEEAP